MMGIDNPLDWFSDKTGLGDTFKYKFIDNDHVNIHDSDVYYLKTFESVKDGSDEDEEAVISS